MNAMKANIMKGGREVVSFTITDGKPLIVGERPYLQQVRRWLSDPDATVWLPSAGGPVRRPKVLTADWVGHRLMGRPVWAEWDNVKFEGWEPKPWPELPAGTVA